ncbi:hypothetical protein [Prochlorococcus sp. MIT 1011]|uniref:hypothetical protein n=1 Tax=Prochlorococcus sp. MIT 1011 TaxID=3082520 RepID=UPI0039B588FB
MKIGYFADGPWSYEALNKLVDDSRFQIVFICARYKKPDPYLKKRAKEIGTEFLVEKM